MISYIKDIALLAIAVVLFMAGRHMGRGEVQVRWDKERVQHANEIARQERDYATQLSRAETEASAARIELARIRAAPVPRVLCHQAPAPVSRLSAPASDGVASSWEFSPVAEFDPTDALFAEADRADELVESCRDMLNRWPVSG